ncbi:MAG: leucine-rich repeat protein, partial [Oscillospiraceae bacterium]|nr:leucine-rich repeat protein [Oscillospiraceae bacterium]
MGLCRTNPLFYPCWGSVENADSYWSYWEKKNENGEYVSHSDSSDDYWPTIMPGYGLPMWASEEGEYRYRLKAINSATGEETYSDWIEFTVVPYEPAVPVVSIDIPETLQLEVGESIDITVAINPESAEYRGIVWFYFTENVISIQTIIIDGEFVPANVARITALAPGEVSVMAFTQDGDIFDSCTITVVEEIEEPIEDANGTCGENVTWQFKADSGTLSISGTGAMADYENNEPWKDFRDVITAIEINDGVTSIGNYAFYSCTELSRVSMAASVTTIGEGAFCYCGMTSIVIPSAVTYIGEGAFSRCGNLTEVTFCGNAPTFANADANLIAGSNVFAGVTAICYYPEGDETWTNAVMQNYGGNLTWRSYQSATAPTKPAATMVAIVNGMFEANDTYLEGDVVYPLWTLGENTDYCNSYWERYDETSGSYIVYQTLAPDNYVQGMSMGVGIYTWDPGQFRYRVEAVNETSGEKTASDWVYFTVEDYVPNVAPTGIDLPAELTLAVGESADLTAKIVPENADYRGFTWLAYDASVATLSYGTEAAQGKEIVTAVAPGTTTIQVCTMDGDVWASCTITVVEEIEPDPAPAAPAVPVVTLSPDLITPTTEFIEGDYVWPMFTVDENTTHCNSYWEKLNTTTGEYENLNKYTPDNYFGFTAGSANIGMMLWATEPGSYRYRAEAVNTGGYADSSLWATTSSEWIEFTVAPFEPEAAVTAINIPSELTMELGATEEIIASVSPDGAEYRSLIWINDFASTSVVLTADATDSLKATVTANSLGSSTISVCTADGDVWASCTITVVEEVAPSTAPAKPEVYMTYYGFGDAVTAFIEGDYVYPYWGTVENADSFWSYWERRKANGEYSSVFMNNDAISEDYWQTIMPGYGQPYWVTETGDYRYRLKAVNNATGEETYSDWIEFTVTEFEPAVPVTSIDIPDTLVLEVGESAEINVVINPYNAEYRGIVWFCSITDVASVQSGFINGEFV